MAYFAAGSDANGTYAVTVDGTKDIGVLVFEEGNVTLSGGGLRMTEDTPVGVVADVTATIDTPISESTTSWLAKCGEGTLILSGTNTYTGVTAVVAGTLSVSSLADAGAPSNIGAYPTAGADGLVLAGGTLEYTGGNVTTDRGFTLGGDSTIDVSTPGAALTLGECSGSGNLTVTGGAGSGLSLGAVTFGGTVTVNSGKLTLPGVNTYGGNTTVNGGTLEVTGSCNNSVVTVKAGGAIAGGGSVKRLTIDPNAGYIWGYADGGDHTMDVGDNLTLNDAWILKLVDLGDNPQATEAYDLFTFTGNFNGLAVTDAITLAQDANYTLDTTDAPEWDVADIDVIVDVGLTEGFRVYVTGITGSLGGDADGDGDVDAADYIILKTNMGQASGAELADGDFDKDGDVDWYDLQILQDNYGAGSAGASGTIPEPATLGLLAIGAMAMLRRRRNR